jgi:hypothetical protein
MNENLMPPATKARHSARHTTGVIPALSRDRVRIARRWLAVLAPLALVACQHQSSYLPGTPEHGAAIVSRGYDCGLRVERGRVVASYRGAERQRFVSANQQMAVRSYNAPRHCTEGERASVAGELRSLVRR